MRLAGLFNVLAHRTYGIAAADGTVPDLVFEKTSKVGIEAEDGAEQLINDFGFHGRMNVRPLEHAGVLLQPESVFGFTGFAVVEFRKSEEVVHVLRSKHTLEFIACDGQTRAFSACGQSTKTE